jgi:guanine nucleotide-binding protein subunit alpha
MGCTLTKEDADDGRAEHHQIEKRLKSDHISRTREIKILMLGTAFGPLALFAPAGAVSANLCHIRKTGTGDSGKSTVLKQLKLINGGGYSDEERTFFKGVIFTNIVQSMQAVLEAMDVFGIPFASPATANPHASLIFSQRQKITAQELSPDVHRAIKTLWDDAGVRACFSRCSEFQVCDSAQ